MANDISRGDIYDVNWNPARGSEQAGIRPALIVQTDIANRVRSYPVTIVLAISSKIKGYPSMVLVAPTAENGLAQQSEINTGQIITINKDRLGKYYGTLSNTDLRRVDEKLIYMLSLKL